MRPLTTVLSRHGMTHPLATTAGAIIHGALVETVFRASSTCAACPGRTGASIAALLLNGPETGISARRPFESRAGFDLLRNRTQHIAPIRTLGCKCPCCGSQSLQHETERRCWPQWTRTCAGFARPVPILQQGYRRLSRHRRKVMTCRPDIFSAARRCSTASSPTRLTCSKPTAHRAQLGRRKVAGSGSSPPMLERAKWATTSPD